MTTYKTDGGTATLTTAANYDGTTWNGFAVPRATATEVAKYIDDVVAQDGVDREDMEDVFADLELGDEPVALDGIMWEVTDVTEAMTAINDGNHWTATRGDGTTVNVARSGNKWMVSTFHRTTNHDIVATNIGRDEANAVASALLEGKGRDEAQRAGKVVANV